MLVVLGRGHVHPGGDGGGAGSVGGSGGFIQLGKPTSSARGGGVSGVVVVVW